MAGAAGKRSFETRDGPSSFNELPSRIQLHVADILTQVGKLTLKGLTEFLRVNKIDYPPTKDKAYLQKVAREAVVKREGQVIFPGRDSADDAGPAGQRGPAWPAQGPGASAVTEHSAAVDFPAQLRERTQGPSETPSGSTGPSTPQQDKGETGRVSHDGLLHVPPPAPTPQDPRTPAGEGLLAGLRKQLQAAVLETATRLKDHDDAGPARAKATFEGDLLREYLAVQASAGRHLAKRRAATAPPKAKPANGTGPQQSSAPLLPTPALPPTPMPAAAVEDACSELERRLQLGAQPPSAARPAPQSSRAEPSGASAEAIMSFLASHLDDFKDGSGRTLKERLVALVEQGSGGGCSSGNGSDAPRGAGTGGKVGGSGGGDKGAGVPPGGSGSGGDGEGAGTSPHATGGGKDDTPEGDGASRSSRFSRRRRRRRSARDRGSSEDSGSSASDDGYSPPRHPSDVVPPEHDENGPARPESKIAGVIAAVMERCKWIFRQHGGATPWLRHYTAARPGRLRDGALGEFRTLAQIYDNITASGKHLERGSSSQKAWNVSLEKMAILLWASKHSFASVRGALVDSDDPTDGVGSDLIAAASRELGAYHRYQQSFRSGGRRQPPWGASRSRPSGWREEPQPGWDDYKGRRQYQTLTASSQPPLLPSPWDGQPQHAAYYGVGANGGAAPRQARGGRGDAYSSRTRAPGRRPGAAQQ